METKCFVCEKTDKGVVYLKCIHEGKEKFVCVRCIILPKNWTVVFSG